MNLSPERLSATLRQVASRIEASRSPSRSLVAAELRGVLAAMDNPQSEPAQLLNKNTALTPEVLHQVKAAFVEWSEYQSPPENPQHVKQFVKAVSERLLAWEKSISRHDDT